MTSLSNTLSSANSLNYSASTHAHSIDPQTALPVYASDHSIGYNAYGSYSTAMTDPYFSATSKAARATRYTRGWDYTAANYHPYTRVGASIYPPRTNYGATPGYEAF